MNKYQGEVGSAFFLLMYLFVPYMTGCLLFDLFVTFSRRIEQNCVN